MSVDLSQILPMLALVALIGAVAGVIAGMLGVGGGIILVPAFYFAFISLGYGPDGLMQICLATSLATIVVTSLRAVLGHHRHGAVDWGILKGWALGIGSGAVVGVVVASGLRSEVLMVLFGILGLCVGLYLAIGRSHWRLGAAMPAGWVRAIIGPTLGFLSVLMGIGGGSFGVPLMTLYNVAIHRAVGTAAGFGLLIAVPSVVAFALIPVNTANPPPFTIGQVNLVGFLIVVAMTLLTTPIGVRLAHGLDGKRLKQAFAAFVLIMALNMTRKAIWG